MIGKDTSDSEVASQMEAFRELLAQGKQVAFVVRKGALTCDEPVEYKNAYTMTREEIICHITATALCLCTWARWR